MIYQAKNLKQIFLRQYQPSDLGSLTSYLNHLSPETKKRFGPHPFEEQAIADLYSASSPHIGYIAFELNSFEVVAYCVIKLGNLEYESHRLESYGLKLSETTDCAFAPSVSDAWQGEGIGNALFEYILEDLKCRGIMRIILWGGVQSDNLRAVSYYKRNGFRILGEFQHHGNNLDMIREID